MEQSEKKPGENNFAKFISICVVISLILVSLGLCLYRATGTEDLDRSLPKYVLKKE
jgi:hypothetical protein